MRTSKLALAVCGIMLAPSTAAFGQMMWTPGAEIVGQSAQVTTNGVVNTVYFDAGGTARIVGPDGVQVPATWSAAGGNLCLSTGAAQECWPYAAPFQAGQSMTLTSSCNSASTWMAMATNAPPPPPPPASAGERG